MELITRMTTILKIKDVAMYTQKTPLNQKASPKVDPQVTAIFPVHKKNCHCTVVALITVQETEMFTDMAVTAMNEASTCGYAEMTRFTSS